MKTFAFVESNTTGSGYEFFMKSMERGCEPVLLTSKPEKWKGLPVGTRLVPCDTTNPTSIEQKCRAMPGLAAIMSSSDSFVGAAAHVASRLGFCGPDAVAVEAARNKRHQRAVMEDYGLPQPAYVFLDNATEAARFLASQCFRLPAVLKPSCGTGKLGVRLVTTPDEMMEQARLLATGIDLPGGQAHPGFIAEEYIDGDEFSVEVFHGTAVAVVRKRNRPPTFLEIGHSCPAGLPDVIEQTLKDCAMAAVTALRLQWGPVHVEVKVSSDGRLALVEVNPRLAGGNIPALVKESLCVDLIGATLDAYLGIVPEIRAKRQGAAAIGFIMSQAKGVLSGIDGVEAVRRMGGVVQVLIYKAPGDPCPQDGTFRERLGQVLTRGTTPEEAERNVNTALASLAVRMEPEQAEGKSGEIRL